MRDMDARVLACGPMAEGLVRLILHAPEIAQAAQPGQFIQMLVPDSAHVLRRPISLMAFDREAGTLTLGSITDIPLLNLVGKIVLVTLGTAPTVMAVLFSAILIWNVSFIVISLGEEKPKPKKARKK